MRLDDTDGSVGALERTFSIGGVEYAIDLTNENFQRMLDAIEPFRSVARPARRTRRKAHPTLTPEDRRNIRVWAELHGRKLADRGRFPNDVVADYFSALDSNGHVPADSLLYTR